MSLFNNTAILSSYRYDPLDRIARCAVEGEAAQQRFYLKNRLATEIQGQVRRTLMQQGDLLLAQHQPDSNGSKAMLLATDQQRSVLQSIESQGRDPNVYMPYGYQPADMGLTRLPGFNGEVRDLITGHYLLGNGYRAFNPILMRFNSPDSLSPFGLGGLNAYGYCSGDPVNFGDPSGHFGHSNLFVSALQRLQARWAPARPAVATPMSAPHMASGKGALKRAVTTVTTYESTDLTAAPVSSAFEFGESVTVTRKKRAGIAASDDRVNAVLPSTSRAGGSRTKQPVERDAKRWTISTEGANFKLSEKDPLERNALNKFRSFESHITQTGIYPQNDSRFAIKKLGGGKRNFDESDLYELDLGLKLRAVFTIKDRVIDVRQVGVHYRKGTKNNR
jgi:RHS repeat-associated protein